MTSPASDFVKGSSDLDRETNPATAIATVALVSLNRVQSEEQDKGHAVEAVSEIESVSEKAKAEQIKPLQEDQGYEVQLPHSGADIIPHKQTGEYGKNGWYH